MTSLIGFILLVFAFCVVTFGIPGLIIFIWVLCIVTIFIAMLCDCADRARRNA